MYTRGVMIAKHETHQLNIVSFLYGLFFVLNTHVMTHYFNEYYDFNADCNNKNPSPWTGGSRILVEKKLSLRTSIWSGYISAFISLLMLIKVPNLLCAIYGLMMVILGWGYSVKPLKLEYRGLGELDVAVVLNLLVPLWGYSLQLGNYQSIYLLYFLLPLAGIEYARMMVMNMPDRESDKFSGKATLIVRIGMEKAVKIYTIVNLLSYFCFLIFWQKVPSQLIICVLLTFPLGIWLVYRLQRGDWKNHSKMYYIPFWASTHNGLAAATFLLGLIISYPFPIFLGNIELYPLYLYIFSLIYFSLPLLKETHEKNIKRIS